MNITYDIAVDAAYIFLVPQITRGEVAKTHTCEPNEGGSQINLDFDAAGRLLGIEILDASSSLPAELLDSAERME